VPSDLLKQIKAELTLKNPQYETMKHIKPGQRWMWGKEFIELWSEVNMTYANKVAPEYGNIEYVLPRGYFARLWNLAGLSWRTIEDFRVKLPEVSFPTKPNLRDYQAPAVGLAKDWQQGVFIAPCGSGKTICGIGIIAELQQPTLWICHTMDLLKQSMDSAIKFLGLTGKQIGIIQGENMSIGTHITFATVQTLSKRDLTDIKNRFGCIMVDECFSVDTQIDGIAIEKIRKGDYVHSLNHASGETEYGRVIAINKKRPENMLKVSFSNGKCLVCTHNHPFWIEEEQNYIPAIKLMGGQHVRDYSMSLLQEGNRESELVSETSSKEDRKGFLQQPMHFSMESGMVEGTGDSCKIQQNTCFRENEEKQSNEKSRDERKGEQVTEGYGIQTYGKNGQRDGIDKATGNDDTGFKNAESYTGICDSNKNSERERLSDMLQGGCRAAGVPDSDRVGRKQPQCFETEGGGQNQGCAFDLVRVDSVEVLEQTSDGTFGGLCPDGYVYNLEVEENHNYFADGILVHNCHLVFKDAAKSRMFESVISQLPAFYRFGLTASEHRSDGLIETMFHVIGPKFYEVAQDDPRLSVMVPRVEFIETDFEYDQGVDEDGEKEMLSTQQMYVAMRCCERRNYIIKEILGGMIAGVDYCLCLGDSLAHLKELCEYVKEFYRAKAAFVCCETPKKERDAIMSGMREGRYMYLFATKQLSKLGLDIPRLNKLVLLTPHKDSTTTQQSTGRLMRPFEGKGVPVVYDLWDSKILACQKWARERAKVYRDLGCKVKGGPKIRSK
jgi:superfamily II DNA or RNA helicase